MTITSDQFKGASRPLSADVAEHVEKTGVVEDSLNRESFDESSRVPPENSQDAPGTRKIVEGGAFDPEHLGAVQIIMLCRIYDLLLLQLPDEDKYKIMRLHEAGGTLAPPPSWAGEQE